MDPPNGTRQHSTVDQRDSSGDGAITETTLDYRPDGVFLDELKITTKASGITDVTDLIADHPVPAVPTGAGPGTQTAIDLSSPDTKLHLVIKVLREEKVVIGGQAVDTLAIHQTGTFSGKLTGTSNIDDSIAIKYSLFVSDHTVSDVSAYNIKYHSDITSKMQKVTPD